MEEGVWVLGEGVGYSHGCCLDDIDVVTSIRCHRRANVKGTGGVGVPCFADKGGVVNIAELAGGKNGVGSKVVRHVVEAVVGGDSGIGVPGLEVIEGELDKGKELAPKFKGEGDV